IKKQRINSEDELPENWSEPSEPQDDFDRQEVVESILGAAALNVEYELMNESLDEEMMNKKLDEMIDEIGEDLDEMVDEIDEDLDEMVDEMSEISEDLNKLNETWNNIVNEKSNEKLDKRSDKKLGKRVNKRSDEILSKELNEKENTIVNISDEEESALSELSEAEAIGRSLPENDHEVH
ncbi:5694_t:CDS:2, partial [Dentiscutata erythropus]